MNNSVGQIYDNLLITVHLVQGIIVNRVFTLYFDNSKWRAYAIPMALSGVRCSVVRHVSSVSTITTRNN